MIKFIDKSLLVMNLDKKFDKNFLELFVKKLTDHIKD